MNENPVWTLLVVLPALSLQLSEESSTSSYFIRPIIILLITDSLESSTTLSNMAGPSLIDPQVDMTPEPAPTEANFYTLIGKPKSGNPPGIPWNFPNVRRGLRYSDSLFSALRQVLEDRLRGAAIWGENLRGSGQDLTKVLNSITTDFILPDHTPPFRDEAIRVLARLLNEAPRVANRRASKRPSEESHDSFSSKKPRHDDARAEQPDYTRPFFAPAPVPDDAHPPHIILRIGHTHDDKFHLVQLRHIMRDTSLTDANQLWDQLSYDALIQFLETKKFWTAEDDARGSTLIYTANGIMEVTTNEDLQNAIRDMYSRGHRRYELCLVRGALGQSYHVNQWSGY